MWHMSILAVFPKGRLRDELGMEAYSRETAKAKWMGLDEDGCWACSAAIEPGNEAEQQSMHPQWTS